jgi:hypothetical protein
MDTLGGKPNRRTCEATVQMTGDEGNVAELGGELNPAGKMNAVQSPGVQNTQSVAMSRPLAGGHPACRHRDSFPDRGHGVQLGPRRSGG